MRVLPIGRNKRPVASKNIFEIVCCLLLSSHSEKSSIQINECFNGTFLPEIQLKCFNSTKNYSLENQTNDNVFEFCLWSNAAVPIDIEIVHHRKSYFIFLCRCWSTTERRMAVALSVRRRLYGLFDAFETITYGIR